MKSYLTPSQFNRMYGVKLTEIVGHITEVDGRRVWSDLLVVYTKYGKEREDEYILGLPRRAFRHLRHPNGIRPGTIFKIIDGKVAQTPCKPHVRRIIKARAAKTADLIFEKF